MDAHKSHRAHVEQQQRQEEPQPMQVETATPRPEEEPAKPTKRGGKRKGPSAYEEHLALIRQRARTRSEAIRTILHRRRVAEKAAARR